MVKRIDIKEFREKGYLQEANRLFFHRVGLALEVIVDDETGEERLGGIWDYREDPEGILFQRGVINKEKARCVKAEANSKVKARIDTGNCGIDGTQKIEE